MRSGRVTGFSSRSADLAGDDGNVRAGRGWCRRPRPGWYEAIPYRTYSLMPVSAVTIVGSRSTIPPAFGQADRPGAGPTAASPRPRKPGAAGQLPLGARGNAGQPPVGSNSEGLSTAGYRGSGGTPPSTAGGRPDGLGERTGGCSVGYTRELAHHPTVWDGWHRLVCTPDWQTGSPSTAAIAR